MFNSNKDKNHVCTYLAETAQILAKLDKVKISDLAHELIELRVREGRLFVLGIGGSAANSSHAVNDFRKLCNIEAYAPTDNVAEITARTNDEGFHTIFREWLKVSKLNKNDALLILSVGGGHLEKKVSVNLISAIEYAKEIGAKVYSIVGKRNGYAAKNADISIIIPRTNPRHLTPHAEETQSIILHLLVSHPMLMFHPTKW